MSKKKKSNPKYPKQNNQNGKRYVLPYVELITENKEYIAVDDGLGNGYPLYVPKRHVLGHNRYECYLIVSKQYGEVMKTVGGRIEIQTNGDFSE